MSLVGRIKLKLLALFLSLYLTSYNNAPTGSQEEKTYSKASVIQGPITLSLM